MNKVITNDWADRMRMFADGSVLVETTRIDIPRLCGPQYLMGRANVVDTGVMMREVEIGMLPVLTGHWINIGHNGNTSSYPMPYPIDENAMYFQTLQAGAEQSLDEMFTIRKIPLDMMPKHEWHYFIYEGEYLITEMKILGTEVGIRITDRHYLKSNPSELRDWFAYMTHCQQMDRMAFA